jgi:hypothetical protein
LMEGIPRSNLNNEMDYCWAARFICKLSDFHIIYAFI